MSFFSTLRRSISPFTQHFPIQRFQIPHSSRCSSPSILNSRKCFFAAIVAGTSLGFLLYNDFDSTLFQSSISSFVDSSTLNSSENQKRRRFSPSSFFTKFSLPEPSGTFLFRDSYRRKVFFNYEKRIRLRSPPEKVFEYFASHRTPEGEVLMVPEDLMRAVVPVFPPSESHFVRGGYLRGERSPGHLRCSPSDFFMLFDLNGDGHISFKEYIFFVTLLSIPESSFSVAFKMFDVDNNGEITREEFKKVMALMRSHHRQGVQHRDGLRTGLNVNDSVENGGLLEYFFGKDGKGCLQLDKFVQFMRDLHDEILRLEFAHYDYKSRKSISAKDFALSMVASADISHLGKLLERVDELNNDSRFKDVHIAFEDFKNFAELRKKLFPLSLALFSFGKVNGLLTRDDFQRAASHDFSVMEKEIATFIEHHVVQTFLVIIVLDPTSTYQVCGLSLSDNVVEIVFHLFDTNQDGNLSTDEFVRVLHKREKDIVQPVESGMLGFLSCCRNCTENISPSRLFLG